MTLSKGDRTLLLKVLGYAAEQMSRSGCNDTDSSWIADFTDAELDEIHQFFVGGNGGDMIDSRESPAADFCYVHYLEELVENAGE